ncbi:MAG: 50S ribosomal protein L17 [Roseibacillus sp.]|nr:50S ribosomal protein L17 [Roseibacillus sp.]
MRHRKKIAKLQRNSSQRRALLSGLACSLIRERRIRTTLAKAKALRPVAERLITLGKRGDLHARRQAAGFLRQKEAVSKLFADVAPACSDRQGGYCRIVKLGPRFSDSAPMAYIEWVDLAVEVGEIEDEESEESEEAEE